MIVIPMTNPMATELVTLMRAIAVRGRTGTVYAFTESGEWYYKEYPKLINKAGSYLFEPAQSVHTLTVADDATEDAVVSFVINGCNVNVDDKGNVTSIIDAQTILKIYQTLCQTEGKNPDGVIVIE